MLVIKDYYGIRTVNEGEPIRMNKARIAPGSQQNIKLLIPTMLAYKAGGRRLSGVEYGNQKSRICYPVTALPADTITSKTGMYGDICDEMSVS